MSRKIARSPQSRRDLIEIWNYIAEDNEAAADKILDRIEGVLNMLKNNPSAAQPAGTCAGIAQVPDHKLCAVLSAV